MSFLCEIRSIVRYVTRFQGQKWAIANYSKASDTKKDDENEVWDESEEAKKELASIFSEEIDVEARARKIERMRNKSRLTTNHRCRLHNRPVDDGDYQWEKTVWYVRKQFGRFGYASGVDPRFCYDTPDEADDKREYERVAYNYTISSAMEANRQAKIETEAAIKAREDKIATNLVKLDKWIQDMNARMAQKTQLALEAKEKRERIMEEVRQHFGFKIDFRDPRFQALIEEKEKEQKKAKKQERKKKQETVLLERLQEQAKELTQKKTAKKDGDDDDDSDDEKKN